MKKALLALIITFALALTFTACTDNSPEAQLREAEAAADAAQEAYEQSLENYNDLMDDIEDYNNAVAALEEFE